MIAKKNRSRSIQTGYCSASICECDKCGGVDCGCHTNPSNKTITNSELLELDVEILIPAALDSQITLANADRVRAHTIVEVANGPTTNDADTILARRGITVVPDILANSGGVTVSYFEWAQNRSGVAWSEGEVRQRLLISMNNAFARVMEASKTLGVSLRTAAYACALEELGRAHSSTGTAVFFNTARRPNE
jgi:glutamate dehydrogenase (NADP+)